MFRNTTIALLSLCAAFATWLFAQSRPAPLIVNAATAQWTHEANDPPGTEAILLRRNAASGSMELMVRFPAGHVIKPHWHDSDERILVLEGRLAIGQEQPAQVEAGGYAFLPARQTQYLTCASQTRCTFYLGWDGNAASHAGTAPK
jgi:quercetin dioxygenase-like cupin family protein